MYYIYKNHIYIKNPSEAPEGVKVETGKRGGIYYESEGQSTTQSQEQSFESKLKNNEIPDYKNQLTDLNTEQLKDKTRDVYQNSFIRIMSHEWYMTNIAHANLDNAVTKAFNLNVNTTRPNDRKIDELNDKDIEDFKKLYTITQIYLKKKYPTGKIILYRGVDGKTFEKFKDIPENSKVNLNCYNLSSWTEDKEVALSFGKSHKNGITVMTEVSIEQIFLHYEINPMAMSNEKEAILIGSEVQGTLVKKYKGSI